MLSLLGQDFWKWRFALIGKVLQKCGLLRGWGDLEKGPWLVQESIIPLSSCLQVFKSLAHSVCSRPTLPCSCCYYPLLYYPLLSSSQKPVLPIGQQWPRWQRHCVWNSQEFSPWENILSDGLFLWMFRTAGVSHLVLLPQYLHSQEIFLVLFRSSRILARSYCLP